MKQLKETYNPILEKYIIKSFPIVPAFEGIEKYENLLIQFGYLVVFDEDHFIGIVTPFDLLKRQHKLLVDCCLQFKPFEYSSGIQDVFNYIKEQNSHIIPVFKDKEFYGILIFVHLVEQLFSEHCELLKKIQDTEKEVEYYKNQSLIPEQIKNEFIQNISHEFRTPANAIVGFSELISSKNMDEEKRRYFLSIIRSSSFRLLKMIDDLVEMARVKYGDIKFEYHICSIDDLFTELLSELGNDKNYTDKNLTDIDIKIDKKAREYFFTTDKYRIKQVLGFLIDNAFKYSSGEKITLECKLHDSNKIEFNVNNKGSVIPTDKISSILEGFNKFEDQQYKFQPGLGLGLAISNRIVVMMGGELGIKSNEEDGTSVFFLLPISAK